MTDAIESLLADPASALVALDFDGTLAPIVPRPEDAALLPGAYDVLTRLSVAIGQLAVVSGRAADDVVHRGGLEAIPGLVASGHYGLQTWRAGALVTPPPDPGIEGVRERLPALLTGAPTGVFVEDKHHSIAVHTRRTEFPQAAFDDLAPTLESLAAELDLELTPGRYVLELRPPGVDKGTALRTLVEQLGARTVIYVGDDVGDLSAFAAVRSLRAAGSVAGLAVVAVGRDDEVPPRLREAADLELLGPAGVVAWLGGLVERLELSA